MQNLHLKLTSKYPKYNNWHQSKHHNKIHWGVLVVFALIVFALILNSTNQINAQADITPPSIPANLTATAVSSSQINLSWTASTDDVGVTGYNIYRCAGSACAPTVQIETSAINSYSNTGLTSETAYTYAVSAYDAAGNESGKSNQTATTTKSPPSTSGAFGPQSSSKNIEWGFDFVETFDGLQDWKGNNWTSNNVLKTKYPNDFPKIIGGSDSAWDYYSMYVNPNGENWIANHGSANIWGGTGKSLRLDLSGVGNGPNRFGLYFGDGTPESGYDDIYIFHMVRIDKNQWPTYIDKTTNIGKYEEGKPYTYFWSWKFGSIDMGMTAPHEFNYDSQWASYSPYHITMHIKPYYYEPLYGKLSIIIEPNDNTSYVAKEKSPEDFLPNWWGIEFHFRNENNFTYQDVWLYDANGNSWRVLTNAIMPYTSQPASHKWNEWFFGGNNSNNWIYGDTMRSPYYVDDFIVNGSRIGPKYFSLINGTTPPPDITAPTVPAGFSATAVSLSQINLSWSASVDDVGVTGYKIFRCAGLACAPTVQIGTSATNSYSNTGLTASIAYTYAVSAYDAAGNESAKSQSVSATTLSQFKPSDLNQDQKVDQQDFDILKQDWRRTDKPKSDLNQDGIVNSQDLGIMMSEWTR